MWGRYCTCEILIANTINWLFAACLEYFIFFSIDSSEARKQYDEYCLSIMQTITYAHDRTHFQCTTYTNFWSIICPLEVDLREWNWKFDLGAKGETLYNLWKCDVNFRDPQIQIHSFTFLHFYTYYMYTRYFKIFPLCFTCRFLLRAPALYCSCSATDHLRQLF